MCASTSHATKISKIFLFGETGECKTVTDGYVAWVDLFLPVVLKIQKLL